MHVRERVRARVRANVRSCALEYVCVCGMFFCSPLSAFSGASQQEQSILRDPPSCPRGSKPNCCIMSAERGRYQGGADAIADIVSPYATTARWLQYAERDDEGIDAKVIKKFWPMILELEKLQSNLAFKKTTTEEAMDLILSNAAWKAKLEQKDHNDWRNTMAARLRVLCRHTQQSKLKDVAWLARLRKGEATTEGSQEQKGEETKNEGCKPKAEETKNEGAQHCGENKDKLYGFDYELKAAWRTTPRDTIEHTSDIFVKPGAADDDMVFARFDDGEEKEVAGVLVKDFREMMQRPAKRRHASTLVWSATCDEGELVVRPRTDRTKLMSLYLNNKQICMAKVDLFQDEDAAFAAMQSIGEAYKEKKMSSNELYKMRDGLVQRLGVKKRPAGAQPAGAQPAGAQPAGVQPAGAQPAGAQLAGAQPAGSSTSKELKQRGAQPAGAQPARSSSSGSSTGKVKKRAAAAAAAAKLKRDALESAEESEEATNSIHDYVEVDEEEEAAAESEANDGEEGSAAPTTPPPRPKQKATGKAKALYAAMPAEVQGIAFFMAGGMPEECLGFF